MMQIMVIYMPIIWDFVPICTIFILHSSNFSRETSKDERDTLTRPLSEADKNAMRGSDGTFTERVLNGRDRAYTKEQREEMLQADV